MRFSTLTFFPIFSVLFLPIPSSQRPDEARVRPFSSKALNPLMLRSLPIGIAAWILSGLGCASRGNLEALEAQLRRQEDQIYAIQSQLTQSESELALARKEAENLRVQLSERGHPTLLPEQSQTLNRITGVRVQRYFSGGLNRDGAAGDDLLNVVVVPHDEDGESLKWPGEIEIEAIDLTAPEDEQHLGVWRFPSEEVARHWQSGLTSGFQFRMPWQNPPATENIVLHARFRTLDGRQFGTSAEIRVTPDPEVVARAKSRRLANRTAETSKSHAAPPQSAAPTELPPLPESNAVIPMKGASRLKPDPTGDSEQEMIWTPLDGQAELDPAEDLEASPTALWQMSPGSKNDRKPLVE